MKCYSDEKLRDWAWVFAHLDQHPSVKDQEDYQELCAHLNTCTNDCPARLNAILLTYDSLTEEFTTCPETE